MSYSYDWLWRSDFLRPFDGENPPPGDPPPVEEKKFTQKDLDREIGKIKDTSRKQSEALALQLEELKNIKNLSEQEKESLTKKIEELQSQHMTAEEIAKRDKKKLEDDYSKKLTETQANEKLWRTRFESQMIDTDLFAAARKHKAANDEQLVDLLRPRSKTVEIMEDGKPSGKFVTKVTLQTKEADGSTKTLELTAQEAVKFMREQPEHGNLFIDESTGGVGGSNANGGKGLSKSAETIAKMSPDQYREWRKKNPDLKFTGK